MERTGILLEVLLRGADVARGVQVVIVRLDLYHRHASGVAFDVLRLFLIRPDDPPNVLFGQLLMRLLRARLAVLEPRTRGGGARGGGAAHEVSEEG